MFELCLPLSALMMLKVLAPRLGRVESSQEHEKVGFQNP